MTTWGSRQYQVVVLVSVPSIFVIRLEGGILVDPGEIREGIFRKWCKAPIPGGGSLTANMGAA